MQRFGHLVKLDRQLIENVFEPIGFWFQKYVGITALALGRFFLGLVMLTSVVTIAAYWFPEVFPKGFQKTSILEIILGPLAILILIKRFTQWQQDEEKFLESGTRVANPRKVMTGLIIIRIILTLVLLLSILNVKENRLSEWHISSFLHYFTVGLVRGVPWWAWCFFYFISCDIVPPSKSWLRERIKAFFWVPKRAPYINFDRF